MPPYPARKLAIVACMDARLDPVRIMGLREGDAHVIRNAGGVVTDDAIRSLAISQHLLGTEQIVLMHHTDCGMVTFTDEEFADKLAGEAGERPSWRAHAFPEIERSVRDSIKRVQDSPFIPNKNVRGYVYEIDAGRLREVS